MPLLIDFPASGFIELLMPLGFLLGYAEIHYRIPFIPSRYFRRQPEIIADIPSRLEPGCDLPILLIVKDADRYPVTIRHIHARITTSEHHFTEEITLEKTINIAFWEKIFLLEIATKYQGWAQVLITIHYQIGHKNFKCHNDNYHGRNKNPLKCYFGLESLPIAENFITGDLHTHSNYTSDQLEFGASPAATKKLAKAMGHDFVGITDHSYDLDDITGNYLVNDPNLRKWQNFQSEVKNLNAQPDRFIIIPGEEVSCGNSRDENLHFLVYNNPQFLPGSGDSGEKWLKNKADLMLPQVIQKLQSSAVCFASHPESQPPFFQWLLLNRGKWQDADYREDGLHGLQIWNGEPQLPGAALRAWVHLLLEGRKLFIIAGTDAHGNFNRFRQITKPFWSIADEADRQIFGMHRNLVFFPDAGGTDNLTTALRKGALSVTTGPFLAIFGVVVGVDQSMMGSTIDAPGFSLTLIAKTTNEFGPIKSIQIFRGDLSTRQETLFWQKDDFADGNEIAESIEIRATSNTNCYYRAHLFGTSQGVIKMQAMTNPIWHQTNSAT